jgi:predicted enzyme related to lactoylglutathione lyase
MDLKLGLILLFVDNPEKSAAFYQQILQRGPLEQSPTFAMFALSNGTNLGLWSRHTAEPKVSITGGGSEIALRDENVDTVYKQWQGLGIPMAQEPTDMDFGRTFVALDPDGHRIRVYRLWEEA